MKVYLLKEGEHLKITENVPVPKGYILYDHAKDLRDATENFIGDSKLRGVLKVVNGNLEAGGAVGLIQVNDCTLEILPKIDIESQSDDEKENVIRKKLVRMMSVALDININYDYPSSMDSQNETILELLIWLFANKLAEAVRYGLSQKYIENEDDLPVLRGSLNTIRQFSVHAANPSRLACKFDEFSPDIALNQVMKSAVEFLSKKSKSLDNQRLLTELSLVFVDITSVSIEQIDWELITIDRTNERWRELLSFAKLFLKSKYQNTNRGSIEGYSLLFSMNTLFEKYIGRLIESAVTETSKSVKFQFPKKNNLIDNFGNEEPISTKPDIVILSGDKVEYIIDAKWKRLLNENNKWDINNPDIFQMIAYSKIYNSKLVTLVYPHISNLYGEGILLRGNIGCGSTNEHKDKIFIKIFAFNLSKEEENEVNKLIEAIELTS